MNPTRNLLYSSLRKSVGLLIKPSINRTCSSIINSGLPDVSIPKIQLSEFIFSKCEKYERFTAIECGLTGRKYTYGEVVEKSKNLSKALRKKLGLRKGDVVAILLPNVPEFSVAILGALDAGLVVTTMNPLYSQEEISRQLRDSLAKTIITVGSFWETASSSCRLIHKTLPILTIKTEASQSLPLGAIDFRQFIDETLDFPDSQSTSPEDVTILPYSSGTTGFSKGVQLTNYNIIANICQNSAPGLNVIQETTATHQDVVPAILPMFHIYGLVVNTLLGLSEGCKIVTLPKFTPDSYVTLLRNYKPQILLLVPPIILFLSGHSMVKRKDLQSIRTIISGAAPLGALDEEKLKSKTGNSIQVLQGYGLTEAPVATFCSDTKGTSGTIGRPLPNTLVKVVAIDDPTGTPLGSNTTGELLIKGPQVMKGYYNKPEETKKTFQDGWLKTGDLVYYNKEEKFIFIVDRLKELIKVKGFQVAPAELEEIIRDFPCVQDAAVIGVPHHILGEAPKAYIVLKKDTRLKISDLEEYVKKKVADYKQLAGGITVVESIPKTAAGKILRRVLKEEHETMRS